MQKPSKAPTPECLLVNGAGSEHGLQSSSEIKGQSTRMLTKQNKAAADLRATSDDTALNRANSATLAKKSKYEKSLYDTS